ncbi:MAG TPA: hypothetical protein VEU97_03330 [Ktedonobacteraceae bacterium]|nr:hypothetical protein [Ktedonobacteraceae bacterium]
MFVSTVGEGSVYTHILPVRRAGRYSFPNSAILSLQTTCANIAQVLRLSGYQLRAKAQA